MFRAQLSLLRGVCQIPAYVAYEKGFFREHQVDVTISIEATAWLVPEKLNSGQSQFALIPWTRVAAASARDVPMVLIAGSGCEEAAIVVRKGVALERVARVCIPQRGGMKDLTALALIDRLGWKHVEQLRQPSGDGAIIAFFGQGADAASMVEPYATMMKEMGIGEVVARTGDLWPGAPGCSLATSRRLCAEEPGFVEAVVHAFVRGERFTKDHPAEAAEIASRYIGVNSRFITEALRANRPDVNAIRNQAGNEGRARVDA